MVRMPRPLLPLPGPVRVVAGTFRLEWLPAIRGCHGLVVSGWMPRVCALCPVVVCAGKRYPVRQRQCGDVPRQLRGLCADSFCKWMRTETVTESTRSKV